MEREKKIEREVEREREGVRERETVLCLFHNLVYCLLMNGFHYTGT